MQQIKLLIDWEATVKSSLHGFGVSLFREGRGRVRDREREKERETCL
jgi:hypothetical protein